MKKKTIDHKIKLYLKDHPNASITKTSSALKIGAMDVYKSMLRIGYIRTGNISEEPEEPETEYTLTDVSDKYIDASVDADDGDLFYIACGQSCKICFDRRPIKIRARKLTRAELEDKASAQWTKCFYCHLKHCPDYCSPFVCDAVDRPDKTDVIFAAVRDEEDLT